MQGCIAVGDANGCYKCQEVEFSFQRRKEREDWCSQEEGEGEEYLLSDSISHLSMLQSHWSSHLLGALGPQTTAQDTGLLGEVCGCDCLERLKQVTSASLIRYLVSVHLHEVEN